VPTTFRYKKHYLMHKLSSCLLLIFLFQFIGSSQGMLLQTKTFDLGCIQDIHVDGDNMYAAINDNKVQSFENGIWYAEIKLENSRVFTGAITKDLDNSIWSAIENGLFEY